MHYRCVVLPDIWPVGAFALLLGCLNAPTGAWCSLTRVLAADRGVSYGLNAPTGAWCSLTIDLQNMQACYISGLNAPTGAWCSLTEQGGSWAAYEASQCTYRCVVLPDPARRRRKAQDVRVSMHLQVRGAP